MGFFCIRYFIGLLSCLVITFFAFSCRLVVLRCWCCLKPLRGLPYSRFWMKGSWTKSRYGYTCLAFLSRRCRFDLGECWYVMLYLELLVLFYFIGLPFSICYLRIYGRSLQMRSLLDRLPDMLLISVGFPLDCKCSLLIRLFRTLFEITIMKQMISHFTQ